MKKQLLLATMLAAVACASPTPYQRKDSNGGYAEVPLDGRTYVVSFDANSQTDPERVKGYLHYRCAELTAEAGYTHFVVLHVESGSDSSTVVTSVSGGPMFPTAVSEKKVRPHFSVVIQMFKGAAPPGAFQAAEVLRLLGPRIGQPDHLAPASVAAAQ